LARTALLCLLPGLLIATGWSQLESPPESREITLVVALGIGVALISRRRLQLLAAAGAFLVVIRLAFGLLPLDARPFDGDHNFVGPFFSGIWNGFLDYYDVTIPFDPIDRPRMHGVLLLAAFVFTLGASLAIARRRPVLASALTFAGAAWPVTLIRDAPSTARGALLLVASLLLLAALRPGAGRGSGQTALVGAGVVIVALIAAGSPAVAKGGFLNWERWEPYTRPDKGRSVSYVWDANYSGINFPKRPTTVLTIKASQRAPYWRATTLDTFIDNHWKDDALSIIPSVPDGDRDVLSDDEFLPPGALDSQWMEQEVTVRALRDTHLVGATVPIAFQSGVADDYYPGVAYISRLHRDQRYKVWSYVRQPSPRDLARSKPVYPDEVHAGSYLGIGSIRGPAPPFGTPGRDAAMRELFHDRQIAAYEPLYNTALRVVGRPRNPYAAAVALEAWFRTGGGFRYDEHPPASRGVPPLVAFVDNHRRGYCQHFAGAMALMLRYLGVPARVGAGFTSGRYNASDGEWTVADTNAHTWVEVWFNGYGWLPFDPTPGRGRLRGSYTASSLFFDVSGATSAFGAATTALGLEILRTQFGSLSGNRGTGPRGLDPGGRAPARDPGGSTGGGDRGGGSLIGLLALIGAVLTAALWLVKFVRRRLRYLTDDPRRLAGAVRLELVDYLVDQRLPVSASATPDEVGMQLDRSLGIRGDRLAEALAAARYGPDEGSADAAAQARKELRTVRSGLRRRLGARAKLRGLLSLRSLGFGSP
jgi:transglutaminase-like putative cysteine protease